MDGVLRGVDSDPAHPFKPVTLDRLRFPFDANVFQDVEHREGHPVTATRSGQRWHIAHRHQPMPLLVPQNLCGEGNRVSVIAMQCRAATTPPRCIFDVGVEAVAKAHHMGIAQELPVSGVALGDFAFDSGSGHPSQLSELARRSTGRAKRTSGELVACRKIGDHVSALRERV